MTYVVMCIVLSMGQRTYGLYSCFRALNDGDCINTHTIIIVAFDLEELGTHGSLQFIQDLLIPRLLTSRMMQARSQFRGAIIMDCNINYDEEEDSQDMEEDWWNIVPEAAKNIFQDKSELF